MREKQKIKKDEGCRIKSSAVQGEQNIPDSRIFFKKRDRLLLGDDFLKKTALIAVIGIMLSACSKPVVENTSALEAITAVCEKAGFDTDGMRSLSDIDAAEECGINPNDIEEGYIVVSPEKGSPDKIILAKGRDIRSTENIEKSLSNLLINLSATYRDDPDKSKKIEKHLFKTRDKMTLLAVCDDPEELEEVFNSFS